MIKFDAISIAAAANAVLDANIRGDDEATFMQISFDAAIGSMIDRGYVIRVIPPEARWKEYLAKIDAMLSEPRNAGKPQFVVSRLAIEAMLAMSVREK